MSNANLEYCITKDKTKWTGYWDFENVGTNVVVAYYFLMKFVRKIIHFCTCFSNAT